ncbi:MAG: HDOD domain-containing protein [Opitutaceae bacterium]
MIATPVTREMLLNVVKVLPTAPQILARLGQLLLDMDSGLPEVTELLRRDAGLTARIIRVANSSVYNKGLPSSSLEEALGRVGFKEVYRLTGFAAVAQITEQNLSLYGVSGAQLRENSLLTALVMETMASAAGVDPRLAYTAGLLRSTGKIALDRMLRHDPAAGGFASELTPLAERESGVAGMHNGAAAGTILAEWHFRDDMIAGIRDHYLLDESAGQLAQLLNLAAGEAERSGYGFPGETGYWDVTPERLASSKLSREELSGATEKACGLFESIRAVVG